MSLLVLAAPEVRAQQGDAPQSDEEAPLDEAAADQGHSALPAELPLDGLPPLVPPELVEFVQVPYPFDLDHGRVEVLLHLLIDEQGAVEEVLDAQGPEPFASLARWAAARIRFSPALELGVPTAVELPFGYVFEQPPVNVSGTIQLHGTRSPAEAVRVGMGARWAVTDNQGRFELRNVAPGDYQVRCEDRSLRLDPVQFRMEPGEHVELEIWALRNWEGGELVGTYRKRRSQVIRRSLTAKEVSTTPGTLGDPVRAVQNLPGLARTPLDAGWLLVRGGDPEDTGLYMDGIRVPLVYHLMGLNSVVHPAFLDQVAFHPGGYDVRYGRATGGAVDLRTRRVHGEGLELQAGVDLVQAGGFARVPLGKKMGMAAAVRRSYLDGVLGAAAKRGWFGLEEGAEDIAPRFWDWQLRLDRKRVGIFALGYDDLLNAPRANDDGTVLLHVGTRRLHGRAELPIKGKILEITPVLGADWHRLSYPGYDDGRNKTVFGSRFELLDSGSGPWGWSAGLDVEAGNYNVEVETEDHPAGVEVDAAFGSTDPYADLRIGEDPSVTLGVRLETLFLEAQLPRAMPSPRARARYPVSEWLALVGSAGVYHQWPPLDYTISLPNGPSLRMERATGGGLGLQAGLRNFSLESAAYGRALRNVTLFAEDASLGQGDGVAYGVENLARLDGQSLGGWISYTWSRSFRREELGHLWDPHAYDQPHNLIAVLAWDLPGGWVMAGRFRVSSGYPVADDVTYAYDVLIQSRRCIADSTMTGDETESCPEPEHERLPPNHSLDLKITRLWAFKSWSLEAYLDIQNIYNRRNPEPVITGSVDLGTLYAWGMPILPIFGVKGMFRTVSRH